MKIYADDDPVWKAPLTMQDARSIWAAVINQACMDATKGGIAGRNYSIGGSSLTQFEHESAKDYIASRLLDFHCDLIGLDAGSVRKRVAEYV